MASSDSASTSPISTPMVLTPESTGSRSSNSELRISTSLSETSIKKARRQTAFYPNVNSSNKQQKPFSRSAAKRESVMALGSIEHLQHYFTKTGIAAKKTALSKPNSGLVPALGGLSHIRNNSSLSDFQLPPSPAIPAPPPMAYPPMVKTYETNPETLLPGVIDDLTAVANSWGIDGATRASTSSPGLLGENTTASGGFDILGVLKTTTRTIRSIRNYVVSLPDESTGTLRAQFRSKLLAASLPVPKRLLSQQAKEDPLSVIRKSALELLSVLRELEEKSRLPLSDDAYDAQSDGGRHSRVASPASQTSDLPPPHSDHEDELVVPGIHEVDADTSIAFSLVSVHGRLESVPVWAEDDDQGFVNGDEDDEKQKRELWDERLVLGSGWLYKQDIKLEDLGREQDVVRGYLDVVDELLFGGTKNDSRGWERERQRRLQSKANGKDHHSSSKSRRVSAGDAMHRFPPSLGGGSSGSKSGRRVVSMGGMMGSLCLTEEPETMESVAEEEGDAEVYEEPPTPSTHASSDDDEDLPPWARKTEFMDEELDRAHALLAAFLPIHLISYLAPAFPRLDFLACLSSGQILCHAYNACVRKSHKPWGYISMDAVHDIFALEKADKEAGVELTKPKSWTFRRIDNLRLWAGALKLRYTLPIVSSSSGLTPTAGNTPVASPSPTKMRFPSTMGAGGGGGPPIVFDAKIIAKKEEGWDTMLENTLKVWMRKVVDERRDDR